MLYQGQLNDLEFMSPVDSVDGPEDFDSLIDSFESLYGKTYGLAARTPEFGHVVTSLFAKGVTEIEKPELPSADPIAADGWQHAVKSKRDIYWRGNWYEATILDLDRLRAGNEIQGPAIVESPSSTMVIPPDRLARLDTHHIFHMESREIEADR